MLGATVCTFDRLFDLVAQAAEVPSPPRLSAVQRIRVAREAVGRTEGLRLLAASSSQAGFAAALDDLVGDLQAARVDPGTLAGRANEAGPYEMEVARLYAAYARSATSSESRRAHARAAAIAALADRPEPGERARSSSTASTT